MAHVNHVGKNAIEAHARDEKIEWPLVRASIAFEAGDRGIAVVISFETDYGPDGETEEAAKIAFRLKELVVATLRPNQTLWRLAPGEHPLPLGDWASPTPELSLLPRLSHPKRLMRRAIGRPMSRLADEQIANNHNDLKQNVPPS